MSQDIGIVNGYEFRARYAQPYFAVAVGTDIAILVNKSYGQYLHIVKTCS